MEAVVNTSPSRAVKSNAVVNVLLTQQSSSSREPMVKNTTVYGK